MKASNLTGVRDVLTPELDDFIRRAERIYEQRLAGLLEADHRNEFVAIEPDSGSYFLGRTLTEAMRAARDAFPDRLLHAMRVGHKTALHLGGQVK